MKRENLSPKEEEFCRQYLVLRNGTRAAIAAGYSDCSPCRRTRNGVLASWAHEENKSLLAWLQWSGFRVEGKDGVFLKCVLRSPSPSPEKNSAKEVEASCVCRRCSR